MTLRVAWERHSPEWRSQEAPIGRFIPLNPRDGAELALPGIRYLRGACFCEKSLSCWSFICASPEATA